MNAGKADSRRRIAAVEPEAEDEADGELSRAAETAYRGIRTRILSGELPGGAFLIEEDLASLIGVSRTPIRESLKRLSTEGLVVLKRYRRGRVVEISGRDVEEIYELRMLMEPVAAGRAAKRISDADLDKLDRNIDQMTMLIPGWNEPKIGAFIELNADFHMTIIEAAGLPRLRNIVKPLIDMPTMLAADRPSLATSPEFIQAACDQHRQIVIALRTRHKRWSSTQMQAHLLASSTRGMSRT